MIRHCLPVSTSLGSGGILMTSRHENATNFLVFVDCTNSLSLSRPTCEYVESVKIVRHATASEGW
jgi:hypothetical protein